MNVREVLELRELRQASPTVVAGVGSLDREVRWSHVIDVSARLDTLEGGEFVLAVGLGGDSRYSALINSMEALAGEGAIAVAINLDPVGRGELPARAIKKADELRLPLVVFRGHLAFTAVVKAIQSHLLHHDLASLRHANQLQHRFAQVLFEGGDIASMLGELALVVGNPVVLEDAIGRLIMTSAHSSTDDAVLIAWEDLERAREQGTEDTAALSREIKFRGRTRGRVAILPLDSPIEPLDDVALEQAILAIALGLQRRDTQEEFRGRARHDLVADLTVGRLSELTARKRASGLGFKIGPRNNILPLAVAWRVSDVVIDPAGGEWTPILASVRDAILRVGVKALIAPLGQELLLLVGFPPGEEDGHRIHNNVADAIRGALEQQGIKPASTAIAIGASRKTFVEVGEDLQRVREAARAARSAPYERWHDASRVTLVDLLHGMRGSPLLAAFVDDQLRSLIEHDRTRAGDLLVTLETYLASGARKSETAKSLCLQRRSVYARLERIGEVIGVDLDRPETRLSLGLALRALQVLYADTPPPDE